MKKFLQMIKLRFFWVSIAAVISAELLLAPVKLVHASFGAEIPFLIKIIAEAIQQVKSLQMIIGTTRETVGILNDMNRGVREVLRLAETAHVPIPRQIYESARTLEEATREAQRIYGPLSQGGPAQTQRHFQAGTEGLYLSHDAFEYSTFLDVNGERIKSSAITASQGSATRLTAESMGVLIHAVSHANRIQAKSLEIQATNRLESSSRENARFESFIHTQSTIEENFRQSQFSNLNSFDDAAGASESPSSTSAHVRTPEGGLP